MNKIQVLDHGFVSLISCMGDDLTVVNAASVSFAKHSPVMTEKDYALLLYLARNAHWTPFGHPQLTLHFKMPIFVARQFMRSNVGICYNEISRRYIITPPEFYIPTEWRRAPTNKKQGSGPLFDADTNLLLTNHARDTCEDAVRLYNYILSLDLAPELARMLLPQSLYTEFWATMSLAAAHRIYSLRVDSHAQLEVQHYARAMNSIIYPLFPYAWSALTNPNPTPAPAVKKTGGGDIKDDPDQAPMFSPPESPQ